MLLQKKEKAPALTAETRLWWQPKKIAVCKISQSYYTIDKPSCKDLTKYLCNKNFATAVSPEDIDGKIWYIAYDIDSGRRSNLETVCNTIAKLIGNRPLVSLSGSKGWHVWLFLDKPLEKKKAIEIAERIADKAGVLGLKYIADDGTKRDAVEIFPMVDGCLKLPGQPHPTTGQVEEFVNDDDSVMDTEIIMNGLADGMWRVPAEKMLALVPAAPSKPRKPGRKPKKKVTRLVGIKSAGGGVKIIDKLDDLACLADVALSLTPGVSRIGQSFHCVLPGHGERRRSAAWYRMDNGCIIYHDFHARDSEEWYTISEVYYAVKTGQVQKLDRVQNGRWLARLGLELGYRTPVALEIESLLSRNLEPTINILMVGVTKRRTKTRARVSMSKYFGESDKKIMCKIIDFVGQEALTQAMGGFREIALSKRFLAENTGVSSKLANRAMNLLCVLGVLEKVPGTGGMAGDRYILSEEFDPRKARRRWDVLGRPSLRALNRSLVERVLGKEFASGIFRRSPER